MSNLELYSMPLCPFAHRVRLVLAEKGIDYRLIEIDLGNKPQAFLRISPYRQGPGAPAWRDAYLRVRDHQ